MAVNSGNLSFGITIDTNKLRSDIENVKNQFASMSKEIEGSGIRINKTWQDVAKGIAAVAGVNIGLQGLRQFGQEVLRMTGLMQGLTLSFETMLGTKEQADRLMMGIKEFALATPYTVEESATTVKQLIAMNAAGDDVLQTFKTLGDVAAGLNVPLQRIAINYGQVAALGRLQQREIRDFAMAGIPINEELAKVLGVSVQEVQKLVFEGKVGFPAVQQAFKNMSGEGGRFADMMIKMNSTVMGQMSRLKDQIQLVFAEIGDANTGIIYNVIGGAATLVKHYEEIGKTLMVLVSMYGAYKVVLAATAVSLNGWTIAHLAGYKALLLVEKAQRLLNATILKNPYAIVASLLVGMVTSLILFRENISISEKIAKDFNDRLDEMKTRGNELIATVNDETAAWKDREDALKRLQELYPEIFKNMDIMSVKTADQTALIKQMTLADYEQLRASQQRRIAAIETDMNRQRIEIRDGSFLTRGAAKKQLEEYEIELAERQKKLAEINGYIDAENKKTDEFAKQSEIRNKAYWENQKKEAQAAIDAMEITAQGSIEWSRQMALITEADQKLKAWSPVGQTTQVVKSLDNQIIKDKEELNRALIELERDYQDSVIAAMQDGAEKRQAQLLLDTEREIKSIQEKYAEIARLQGGSLPSDIAIVDTETNRDLMLAGGLTPEQVQQFFNTIKQIETTYWRDKNAIIQESIDKEIEDWNNYLAEFGSTQEKILATQEKYDKLIAEAKTKGAKKTYIAESQREIERIRINAIKESDIWKKLFEDTGRISTETLKQLFTEAEALISNSTDLSIEEQRRLYRELNRIRQELATRNPFSVLKDSYDEYIEAVQGGDADQIMSAWGNISVVTEEIKNQFTSIGNSLGSLFSSFGASGLANVVDGVVSSINNAVTAFEKLGKSGSKSTGDVIQGVSGIIGIITTIIGSLVNYFQRMNKEARSMPIEAWESAASATGFWADNMELLRLRTSGTLDNMYELLSTFSTLDAAAFIPNIEEILANNPDFAKRFINGLSNIRFNASETKLALQNLTDETAFLYQAALPLNKVFVDMGYNVSKAFGFDKFNADQELMAISQQVIALEAEAYRAAAAAANVKKDKEERDYYLRLEQESYQKRDKLILDGAQLISSKIDAILGTTVEGISDRLSNALVQAFRDGTDAAEAWGKAVEEVVQDMAINAILTTQLESAVNKVINDLGLNNKWYDSTGKLIATPEQIQQDLKLLQAALEAIGVDFTAIAEGIANTFGMANQASGEARTASSQGFAQASQDSIDALMGIIINIENNVHLIRQNLEGNGVQNEAQIAANIIINNIYTQVLAIRDNTDRLENMENYMRVSMNSINDGVVELQKLNR